MADTGDKKPIIIVRRRRAGETPHHGGAWKVAYADFVTALMAFFLVMWLVATVSDDQRAALFDYFKNPSMESGRSPKAAPGQMGPGGASTSPINMRGGLDAPRAGQQMELQLSSPSPDIAAKRADDVAVINAAQARKIAERVEREQLESLMDDLKRAIAQSQALAPFKDQLLIDITPEGLRIQIIDAQNRPMFDLGRAQLKDYTDAILHELSHYLGTVPNRISISGHTDVTPWAGRSDYSNWELSADRANAARRSLESGGLATEKIARVVGLSSAVLFDKAHPQSPVNRRISIIVMTKSAEEAALRTHDPTAARALTASVTAAPPR